MFNVMSNADKHPPANEMILLNMDTSPADKPLQVLCVVCLDSATIALNHSSLCEITLVARCGLVMEQLTPMGCMQLQVTS